MVRFQKAAKRKGKYPGLDGNKTYQVPSKNKLEYLAQNKASNLIYGTDFKMLISHYLWFSCRQIENRNIVQSKNVSGLATGNSSARCTTTTNGYWGRLANINLPIIVCR